MGDVLISLIVLTSALLSMWITRRLCVTTGRWRVLDHPNPRSLHSGPMPRSGGLAMVITILVNIGLAAAARGLPILGWLTASLLLLVAVAWLDDRRGVHPGWRLAVQLAAALIFLLGSGLSAELAAAGPVSLLGIGGLVLAVLFMVWMINLYNFMDGMDGLAGGMAVIGFGCLAMLGELAGSPLFVWLNAATAAAALGFLVFNFPPARIFMGDTGSYCLGFLAAAFSLWGAHAGIFPVWSPLLIFSPFIVDATATLLIRAGRHERLWEAHRGHYYQRLAQAGWRHRSIVLWAYGLMVACAASAVAGQFLDGGARAAMAAIWIVVYTVLLRAVPLIETRHRSCASP